MKSLKKVLAHVLAIALAVTCIPPVAASAATEKAVSDSVSVQEDDGLLLRDYSDFGGSLNKRSVAVDSSSLTHNEKFDDYVIEDGIDISHHNGTVNWEKVKAAGIDFTIIRMAYRGYGSAGNIKTDNNAFTNLENAKAAGLDVGVYFFSQAITKAEAIEEANYILNLIKGYDIDLPVVMDFEYTAGEDGRLYAAGLTKRQKTNICLAFCETVEAAGYDAMVYANKSMLNNGLYADEIDSKYEIWLAEWTASASYDNDYTYWQYTSDGSVDGVPSSRVDMNVRYINPVFEVAGKSYQYVSLAWAENTKADGYYIYRKSQSGDYEQVAVIDDPAVLTYKDSGLEMGSKYTYKLTCFSLDEEGNQTEFSGGYKEVSTVTSMQFDIMTLSGKAVDAGTLELTWNLIDNAEGYQIQYYNPYQKKYVITTHITSKETLSSTRTGLAIGTSYKYRIRPYITVDGTKIFGKFSEAVTFTTSSTLKKPVLTAKPYSYTTNKLSWTAVPGATSYQIQKYNYAKKKWVLLKTVTGTSTSNTYLNCSTTYKYRVRAVAKLSGKTVYSNYSAAKTAKTKSSRIGVAKDGPLNIRIGPGTGYKKLTQVKKGRQLTITGSTANWYRVKIKVNGKYRVGYVSKTYVKLK